MANFLKQILFLILLSIVANPQAIYGNNYATDLSGTWKGSSTYLAATYEIEMKLSQSGLTLSGEVHTSTLNNSKWAVYTVNGVLKDNKVVLKSISYIEKKGSWCLPSIELSYTLDEGFQLLSGKWKSNNVKGGCFPGVSGKFNVQKAVEAKPATTPVLVDKSAENMIKGLQSRKYYTLLIAVEDYDDPDIADLDNTIDDASDLWQTISTRYTFDKEYMIFLKNPTRDQLIATFESLSEKLTATDNLLIYYGGHGIWDENLEQGYWLTADAKKASKSAWISNSTIKDYVRSFSSKHTLLIADACFSGGIFKERDAFVYGKAMLQMYKMPSRKAITSGTLTTVPDKSVFMQYLINGLQVNEDPLFSAEQLFYDLKISVINNSPNGQVPQYGVIRQTEDQGGAFIFLKR